MKNAITKRIIALVLALSMALSLTNVSAFAAESEVILDDATQVEAVESEMDTGAEIQGDEVEDAENTEDVEKSAEAEVKAAEATENAEVKEETAASEMIETDEKTTVADDDTAAEESVENVAAEADTTDKALNAGSTSKCGDNLTWKLTKNNTVLTISGTGKMYDYRDMYDYPGGSAPWIPENYKKIKTVVIKNGVTSIGDSAFSWCESLTNVAIPDSVTSIGDSAFEDCESLTSITIPYGVISIGKKAFKECFSLTSVTIPNSVTSIGDGAFAACTDLTSITIPNSITSISDEVFDSCYSLTSVTIPNSVTSIGDSAFTDCSLTSITIPNSVTSIGDYAFYYCDNLTSVTIPDSVTSIGKYAFRDTPWLDNQDKLVVINGILIAYQGIDRDIAIPDSVTSIGESVFEDYTNLYSVTIPGSVISIGKRAFEGSTNLNSVTISDGVTSIGEKAFEGCKNLNSVTIPDSVTSIGKRALGYGQANKVAAYENFAIYGYTGSAANNYATENKISFVSLGESVNKVQSDAPKEWVPLTKEDWEASRECWWNSPYIDENACYSFPCGYDLIANVYRPNDTSWRMVVSGTGGMFDADDLGDNSAGLWFTGAMKCGVLLDGVVFNYDSVIKEFSDAIDRKKGSGVELIFNEGVTSIGSYAFVDCCGLTSVQFPSTLESIGKKAFYCSANYDGGNLTGTVVLPENLKKVGEAAFYYSKITALIVNGNTELGEDCFGDNEKMERLEINGNAKIFSGAFKGLATKKITITGNATLEEHSICYCKYLTDLVITGKCVLKSGAIAEAPKLTNISISKDSIVAADAFYRVKYEYTISKKIAAIKPTSLSASNQKGQKMTLKWKAVSYGQKYQIYGQKYQIQYSTSKSFKNAKTKTVKANSATISKLTKNKKYYVRVRAVYDNAFKAIYEYPKKYTTYSKWSTVKTVTIKK